MGYTEYLVVMVVMDGLDGVPGVFDFPLDVGDGPIELLRYLFLLLRCHCRVLLAHVPVDHTLQVQ